MSLPPEPPDFDGLAEAVAEVAELLARSRVPAAGWVNREGGDLASTGNRRSLIRHVAHYYAAAQLVGAGGRPRPAAVVDVGSGTGALGTWLARRLGAQLHLVDADPQVRAAAAAAFPDATVHAGLRDAPPAALVTAMEVVEHLLPGQQPAFVGELFQRVAPGGLLVLSTPDETRYLGGWSGYGPHVGILTAERLASLLTARTGVTPALWRLNGTPFHVGTVRRVAEPVANRVAAWALRAAPETVARVAGAAGEVAGRLPSSQGRHRESGTGVIATPVTVGNGSGLLAAVERPGPPPPNV